MSRGYLNLGYIGLIALASTVARGAQAQEWTRFRGPNGTGVSAASVPVVADEQTIAWKVKTPGAGHAAPVLWGNKLFVASAEDQAGKQHLLCYDAKSGKQLWVTSREFKPYPKHSFNSFASCTPTVDADRVYINWITPDSFRCIAYDHNGKQLWDRDLGAFSINHGGGTSPILIGDLVIVRSDGEGSECFIAALDRKSGAVKWKTPITEGKGSYSSPVVYHPKGRKPQLIFSSSANGMLSLDPATGKKNWDVPSIFAQRCVSTPVLFGDLIFGTCGDGAGSRGGIAVRAGDGVTAPAVAFSVPKGVPYVPSPVVFGDHLYLWGDSGIVTCVKAATGEQVWMERVGGRYFGSPVCAGGKLYNVSDQGDLIAVEAGPQFKILGRSQLGEGSHSTPAVAGGMLYLRTFTHVIALGGKKL